MCCLHYWCMLLSYNLDLLCACDCEKQLAVSIESVWTSASAWCMHFDMHKHHWPSLPLFYSHVYFIDTPGRPVPCPPTSYNSSYIATCVSLIASYSSRSGTQIHRKASNFRQESIKFQQTWEHDFSLERASKRTKITAGKRSHESAICSEKRDHLLHTLVFLPHQN